MQAGGFTSCIPEKAIKARGRAGDAGSPPPPPIKRPPGLSDLYAETRLCKRKTRINGNGGVWYIWSPGEGIRAFQSGFSQGLERAGGEGGLEWLGEGGGGGVGGTCSSHRLSTWQAR